MSRKRKSNKITFQSSSWINIFSCSFSHILSIINVFVFVSFLFCWNDKKTKKAHKFFMFYDFPFMRLYFSLFSPTQIDESKKNIFQHYFPLHGLVFSWFANRCYMYICKWIDIAKNNTNVSFSDMWTHLHILYRSSTLWKCVVWWDSRYEHAYNIY